jgi:hypothetical protein
LLNQQPDAKNLHGIGIDESVNSSESCHGWSPITTRFYPPSFPNGP